MLGIGLSIYASHNLSKFFLTTKAILYPSTEKNHPAGIPVSIKLYCSVWQYCEQCEHMTYGYQPCFFFELVIAAFEVTMIFSSMNFDQYLYILKLIKDKNYPRRRVIEREGQGRRGKWGLGIFNNYARKK